MTVVLVIGLIAVVAVVVAVAVSFQQRVSSESIGVHTGEHDVLDGETDSYRDHPPGGGTGGL